MIFLMGFIRFCLFILAIYIVFKEGYTNQLHQIKIFTPLKIWNSIFTFFISLNVFLRHCSASIYQNVSQMCVRITQKSHSSQNIILSLLSFLEPSITYEDLNRYIGHNHDQKDYYLQPVQQASIKETIQSESPC